VAYGVWCHILYGSNYFQSRNEIIAKGVWNEELDFFARPEHIILSSSNFYIIGNPDKIQFGQNNLVMTLYYHQFLLQITIHCHLKIALELTAIVFVRGSLTAIVFVSDN
jgi:hypothetical protein